MNLLVHLSETLEEGLHQVNSVEGIVDSAHLANAVHGELRTANVDGANARL